MRIKIDIGEFLLLTEFIEQFLDNSEQFLSYNLDCIDRSEGEEEVLLELLDEKLLNADTIQQGKIHYLRGYLYCTTKYSYKDLDVGLAYFERAILLNDNHKVLSALGCLYKNGKIDGKPNYPKAIELFEEGIALNNSNAMYHLGFMHLSGQVDGQPNFLKAKELFEQASDLKHSGAMNQLGAMYLNGQVDGQPNYLKAKELFEQASALNHSGAMSNLGTMYLNGQVDGQPNYIKAQEFFEKASTLNHPGALYNLGVMYYLGQVDGQPNYLKAQEFFEKASALNHPEAMCRLGFLYFSGQVEGQPNYSKAQEFFEKASLLNHSEAMSELGIMYFSGQVDGQPNYLKAQELFEKAINLSNSNAMYNLGYMYKNGHADGPPNHLKAAKLFRQSWALNSKREAVKNELEEIQKDAIDLPIKYHCIMALCPESIMDLLKESPRIVLENVFFDDLLTPEHKKQFFKKSINYVLYDDLLTLKQKKGFFKHFIEPELEILSCDSLLAEYYLYFAKTDIVNQESYCFKAFEYYHQAKVNNALIALEITHELYYLMAKLYDELGDNYKDAIMLCVHIKDYIPAQHLLAHLLITHTCYLTQQHRHLLCFQALQHQTDLPSIPTEGLFNEMKKQYQTQWQAVKDKPEIEQLAWYLEQNQQALMHANTVLAGCVLVWQLADLNDWYDELEVEKQYKQLLPNLNDVPVLNLCLWKESLQNSMTNPEIQSEENTKRENHRSTLCSDLIQHLDKEISTYTHKWMLFFDSAKTPGIKEIVSKSIHAGLI